MKPQKPLIMYQEEQPLDGYRFLSMPNNIGSAIVRGLENTLHARVTPSSRSTIGS